MDVINLLLNRCSHPKLKAPAPTGQTLENIFQAALRVPDHGRLKPWRFVIVEGDGLARLGQLFADIATAAGAPEDKIARAKQMPLRAPMIIVGIASPTPHANVPRSEQVLSAGCAMMAMQQAAFAQDFGAMWRSGELSHHPDVAKAFSLDTDEEIVGFLYLGTVAQEAPAAPLLHSDDFFTYY
ncbi:NAD(P)H nitroreductase [Corallincola luteus]|uniref:Putative NAD(P)H nitroreductase n=1 Tax=Corallincola luteus TaxID=1775177 RepID=A0ABY2AQX5_9GAMM|nr:NAD(P)H nitroreductase [Corallincola luteus]TCI05580.1 NAD(P)H nitroreductase [Corallincola luteus]